MMTINSQNTPDNQSTPLALKHTRKLSVVFSLGLLAGILIWAKLRLVTDIPRSAYAVPREIEQAETDQDPDAIEIEHQDAQAIDADSITEPPLDKNLESTEKSGADPSPYPKP